MNKCAHCGTQVNIVAKTTCGRVRDFCVYAITYLKNLGCHDLVFGWWLHEVYLAECGERSRVSTVILNADTVEKGEEHGAHKLKIESDVMPDLLSTISLQEWDFQHATLSTTLSTTRSIHPASKIRVVKPRFSRYSFRESPAWTLQSHTCVRHVSRHLIALRRDMNTRLSKSYSAQETW